MKTLLRFEMKKIMRKRSTMVTFFILFALQIMLAVSGSLGSTYVDDVFVETHAERNRIDREYGIAMSGRIMDDALLTEVQDAYKKVDWSKREYLLTDTYQNEVRKYEDVMNRFRAWSWRENILKKGNMTGEALYDLREQSRESMWEAYELSESEKAYWQEKDAAVEMPFVYEYACGFEMLVDMNGGYMTCMLMTFFIAISMVTVFVDEHIRKTDQLILCARYGKGKVYFAKILAGSMVVFGVNLLFTVTAVAGRFYSYGAEGFEASLQSVLAPWYSYPLTMGQTLLLMIGLLFLSSVMTAIFAMLLAEVLRNSIGAMAIIVGLLFAARLITLPPSFGIVSQAWYYFPINMLKIDTGFLDLRLVNLFGLQLPTWQFAPILYVVLIVLMVCGGETVYRKYQVSGR